MAIVYRTPANNMSGWTDIVKQYAVEAGKAVGGKAIKAIAGKIAPRPSGAAATDYTASAQGPAPTGPAGGGKKKSGPSPLLIGGGIAALLGVGYLLTRKKSAAA
jgi:hypothetical protein